MPTARDSYVLTFEDAIFAHDLALSVGGGLSGIPRPELVESAIQRPYSGYYETLEEMAAALVQSMVNNHGFADGNKRTTVILAIMLVVGSGFKLVPASLDVSLNDAVEELVLSVASGGMSFPEIVAWFRARLRGA